jgi:hypothetical protein
MPMPSDHPALTGQHVLARGGWHPRYARVLAVTSDGDYGLAVVDGNGDGAELEAETWVWENGTWASAGSSGAGPLGELGSAHASGQIGEARFAYGSAPGRRSIAIEFDGHRYETPVGSHGAWAFIKVRTDPDRDGFPVPGG